MNDRLEALKRQHFTDEGRRERIARSLTALDAPQPIKLPIGEWKAIVEEVED